MEVANDALAIAKRDCDRKATIELQAAIDLATKEDREYLTLEETIAIRAL
jgi:hypothetical protein